MKIFAITDNYRQFEERHRGPGWLFFPDSSIFRAPNPFFLEEETDTTAAFPTVALRIERLGKSIAPRFAHRYVSRIAMAVNIRNLTLEERLRSEGLPIDPAWGYDKSLLLTDWIEFRLQDIPTTRMVLSGDFIWDAKELISSSEEIIAEISRRNILKMGDIILAGLPDKGYRLVPGTELSVGLYSGDRNLQTAAIPIR